MTAKIPLVDIVAQLQHFCQSKKTGSLFIVSEQQHSAYFCIHQGEIVAARYGARSGKAALQLIRQIRKGSYRFDKTSLISGKNDLPDNPTIFNLLLDPSLSVENHITSTTNTWHKTLEQKKTLIHERLVHHLGPIGGIMFKALMKTRNLNDVEMLILQELNDRPLALAIKHDIQRIIQE